MKISKEKILYFTINLLFLLLAISILFAIAFKLNLNERKKYIGTVIKKEYLPESIKESVREEIHDGKAVKVKYPEKFEEQFNLILKDENGDRTCYTTSKEIYNQTRVGDKIRRGQ